MPSTSDSRFITRGTQSYLDHIESPSATRKTAARISKLHDMTYNVIPLCATILVIFSNGGSLALAVNKQALPKDAVVSVSITFLALGVSFALGCLKIYHGTHESHISRLEPARSAYDRISECPHRLQNRLSRMFRTSRDADGHQANHLTDFFPRKQSSNVYQQDDLEYNEAVNTGNKHQEQDEDHTRSKPQLSGEVPVQFAMQQGGNYREFRQSGHVSEGLQHSPAKLATRAPGCYVPFPKPQGNLGYHSPRAATLQSGTSSIGVTPPHMVAVRMQQEQDATRYMHGRAQGPSHPSQHHGRHPNNHGQSQNNHNVEPESQVVRYPPKASGMSETSGQYGFQHQDLQANLASPPGNFECSVLEGLETTNLSRLMYQITSLAGMPKTREDGGNDGGPILPRHSSKTKTKIGTTPQQSVKVKGSPVKVKSRRLKYGAVHDPAPLAKPTNPLSNPDNAYSLEVPEPAFIKPNTGQEVARVPHARTTQLGPQDYSTEDYDRLHYSKKNHGKSLTGVGSSVRPSTGVDHQERTRLYREVQDMKEQKYI